MGLWLPANIHLQLDYWVWKGDSGSGLNYRIFQSVRPGILPQPPRCRVTIFWSRVQNQNISTAQGLDRVSFQYDEMLSSWKSQEYVTGTGVRTFLPPQRGWKRKTWIFLFEGTARLRDILGQDFRLMVIGDGTERRHLEELARMLGISRQGVFAGEG